MNNIIDNNLMELDDKYEELKELLFNKAIKRYGIFISKYELFFSVLPYQSFLQKMKLHKANPN